MIAPGIRESKHTLEKGDQETHSAKVIHTQTQAVSAAIMNAHSHLIIVIPSLSSQAQGVNDLHVFCI